MKFPTNEYRDLVNGLYRAMRQCRRLADSRLPDGKWTLTEMVGHLIDSFTNNHQRIVRMQLSDHLSFPGYDAEEWKGVSKADGMDYRLLVNLWRSANLYLIGIVERIDEAKLGNVWESPDGPKRLSFIVEDYFAHIEWHRELFERRVAELRAFKRPACKRPAHKR